MQHIVFLLSVFSSSEFSCEICLNGCGVIYALVLDVKTFPKTMPTLTICLLGSSADDLSKQFGPRSGPTKCQPDLDPNCLTI